MCALIITNYTFCWVAICKSVFQELDAEVLVVIVNKNLNFQFFVPRKFN